MKITFIVHIKIKISDEPLSITDLPGGNKSKSKLSH